MFSINITIQPPSLSSNFIIVQLWENFGTLLNLYYKSKESPVMITVYTCKKWKTVANKQWSKHTLSYTCYLEMESHKPTFGSSSDNRSSRSLPGFLFTFKHIPFYNVNEFKMLKVHWKADEFLKVSSTNEEHLLNGPLCRTIWENWHQKGKPFWILMKQELMGGNDIRWTICKSFANHLHLISDRHVDCQKAPAGIRKHGDGMRKLPPI